MCITGVLSVFIVRLLGPSEYGKYSLVWQLIGTIGPIISLGWQATLAKFVPEKTDEEKKSLFTQSFLSVLVASIIFFIIGFFIIQLFPKIIPLEIKDLKFVFLIFIILVAFFNVFEGFYRGLGKFNEWTVIDGLRSNLGNILGIILLIIGHRYYKSIILSNFLFSCFFFFLIFSYLFKWIIIDSIKMLNLRIEKEIQNFVLTMFIGQIVLLFGTTIDSVLLRALLKDPTQVGFYNAGIRIPKVIELMLIAPLPTPFLYYFSHPELGQSKEKILEFGSRLLGVIFGFCGIFLFSFSQEIILFLFGSNYNESIMVLRIFSLILYILGFNILVSPYFQSINKPQIPLIAGIISFVVFFVGDIFLIPKFKSIAPAISVLIGLFIQTMFILYFLSRLNVKYLTNFILLTLCIIVSVFVGFYTVFNISLLVFIICVILTRLITLDDIKRWQSVTIITTKNVKS
jgi:O-antigen/teichoic acid export membrane protein